MVLKSNLTLKYKYLNKRKTLKYTGQLTLKKKYAAVDGKKTFFWGWPDNDARGHFGKSTTIWDIIHETKSKSSAKLEKTRSL